MRGRLFFSLMMLLVASAACDRAATDPSLLEDDRAWAAHGAPNTLPVLFNEALHAAQLRQGEDALNAALQSWQSRQTEVQAAYAAGDPAAVQARLNALRQEEIALILDVLGDGVVTRTLSESNLALADAQRRIVDAAREGAQTAATQSAAHEINELLARANALRAREPARALAIITEAAQLLSSLDDAIIELRRLRGVESLFPEIAGQLTAAELRTHARLQAEAQTALRAGDRSIASAKLAAVRAEEIRLVLVATNDRACAQLLRQVAASLGELGNSLKAVPASDGDLLRLERMLSTASDLQQEAGAAEASGDHARALDLASHAAGLLNSMRHLLVR